MADLPPEIADRVAMMTRRMAPDAAARDTVFLYVRIPEPLDPADRRAKYQTPLNRELEGAGLGSVVGGGQFLGPGGVVAYCGVDVELWVEHRARGFPFLLDTLRRLGAPPGTVIEAFLPAFVEHPLTFPEAEPGAAADRGLIGGS